MKVIRKLTYESDKRERLGTWIALSRPDGPDTMLPGLTVETLHSDLGTDQEIRSTPEFNGAGERSRPHEVVTLAAAGLTPAQILLLWAVLEMKAIDAEHGDDDAGLVEFGLVERIPTAAELRALADWAKQFLTPAMGTDS